MKAIRFYKDGALHRTDGPAVIWSDGRKEWWEDGSLTNVRCIPNEMTDDMASFWFKNGIFHRKDGPAVSSGWGYEAYYVYGKPHRIGGPAIIWPNVHNGSTSRKEWWVDGVLHRDDGPAIIRSDGTKEWWANGKCIKKTKPNFPD